MILPEILQKVKDEVLTKPDLEDLRDRLSHLTADLFLKMAELEKKEALYPQIDDNETEAARKRRWKMTPEGQQQIEVKNWIRAAKEELGSLKSRLYSIY